MQGILALCWVSRAEQSPFRTTISLKTRVRRRSPQMLEVYMLTCLIGEKARICAAGGFVDFGRVNGNLALSRAIGDFEFKKSADLSPEQQIVTAFPDVIQHTITDDDEFLVIACDGECSILICRRIHQLTLGIRYLGLPVISSGS